MSKPPLVIAMAIMADPRRRFTVSTADIMAICRALIEASEPPAPMISIELAEAARAHIAARNAFSARADEIGTTAASVEAEAAFNAFATLFEQEFPNA